jgi:hypothetical protein
MKRIFLAVCFVFLIPFLSFADEVDKGLPANAPSKIKESTRQVIQLGVEPNSVIKMTQRMISDNFTEQQIIAGHDLLMNAIKQDIPTEPIVSRLYEGIAKNASAENILQAMEKVRSRYELANTYTQNMKMDEDKAKVLAKEAVDCLAANIDITSMNKIKGLLQAKTQNANRSQAFDLIDKTLSTARTMAREGVDSKDIVEVMNNAFNRNYNAGQMEKLGNTFMTQARGMSSASDLAKAYSSAIKNGATPDHFGTFDQSMPPPNGRPAQGGPPPNSSIAGSGATPSKSIAGSSAPTGGLGPAPAGARGASAPPPSGAPQGPGPGPGAPPK